MWECKEDPVGEYAVNSRYMLLLHESLEVQLIAGCSHFVELLNSVESFGICLKVVAGQITSEEDSEMQMSNTKFK